jgi:hypothetical protein
LFAASLVGLVVAFFAKRNAKSRAAVEEVTAITRTLVVATAESPDTCDYSTLDVGFPAGFFQLLLRKCEGLTMPIIEME